MPIDRLLSVKNAQVWVSMVSYQKQARKGFRPMSASEGLLVRKVNNLINKRTEHWSCRIFVQQVK